MTDAGTEVGAPRANAIVHWPSGPVPCCLHHADALLKIGAAMGMRPAVFLLSDWDDGAPRCSNCENLLKSGKPLPNADAQSDD